MAAPLSRLPALGRRLFPFRLLIGVAMAIVALEWLSPTPFFSPEHRVVHAAALLVILAALALRAWGAGSAGFHTRSATIEGTRLATGGPFVYTRNPIYMGSILLGVGMSLLIGDATAFVFTALVFARDSAALVKACSGTRVSDLRGSRRGMGSRLRSKESPQERSLFRRRVMS